MRRHVVDKVLVSNLGDEYDIQPSMFYNRQKVLADNAARAFEAEGRERGRPSREAELEQKITQLEAGESSKILGATSPAQRASTTEITPRRGGVRSLVLSRPATTKRPMTRR